MKTFKSFIYEASLLGRTTKYSGSLGAFKQYVELSPQNKEFQLDKEAELYQMDGTQYGVKLKKGTKLVIMDREEKHVVDIGKSKAIRVNITDRQYRRLKGQDFLVMLSKILKPSGKNVEPMAVDLDDKKNPNVFKTFKAGHGHEGQFTEAWILGSGDEWQFEWKGKEYRITDLRAPNYSGPGNPKTDVTVVLDSAPAGFKTNLMKYSLKSSNATYFENWMQPERFEQIFGRDAGSKILNDALKELKATGKIGGATTKAPTIHSFIAKKWNFGSAITQSQAMEVISGELKFGNGEGAANMFFGGDVPKRPDVIQQILKNTVTASDMAKKIKAGISLRGYGKDGNSACFVRGEDNLFYIRENWAKIFKIDKEFHRS